MELDTLNKLGDIYHELKEVQSLFQVMSGYYFSYSELDLSGCTLVGKARTLCIQYPVYTNILSVIGKIIDKNAQELESILDTLDN